MLSMFDLFSRADYEAGVKAKLITTRYDHFGLAIHNYTDAALWEPGAWDNPAVRICRGLITTEDGIVVARPWAKFFNYGQAEGGDLDLSAPVEVTDKMDGSLGIIYTPSITRTTLRVATRGSFASEQAIHASKVLEDRYLADMDCRAFLMGSGHITPLVEVIYPGNRIVCDYGATDDLVLLGGVATLTGEYLAPAQVAAEIGWTGPVVQTFEYRTLADALAAEPRAGAEGLCVRYAREPKIVKIKQDDYKRLHAVITNTSARNLWEAAAVHACKDFIEKPTHWGTYLGIGPDRAAECLAMGEDWQHRVLEGVPDEFLEWVQATLTQVETDALTRRMEALQLAMTCVGKHGQDRKGWFSELRDSVLQKEVMGYLTRGESKWITMRAWRESDPGPVRPFQRDEAVA